MSLLKGIRILDLSSIVMAPMATQILGDLGAEVIKVEPPEGDSIRWIGSDPDEGLGPLFLQANRNKKSIALDLKAEADRERLLKLMEVSDVVVTSIRPQAMSRLKIGYEEAKARNPAIIYCAALGYGSEGPKCGRPVFDDLMQAASGISGLFWQIDGAPRYVPVNICDRTVGLYLSNAILAALFHRERTGEGQSVEVPMFETMVQFVLADHMWGACHVPPRGEMGYRRLKSNTRGPYRTKDGFFSIVLYLDKHWNAFARHVGEADLLERDPRFSNQTQRTVYARDIGAYIESHLQNDTNANWAEFCISADIPYEAVSTIEDLLEDEHLAAVNLFVELDHPDLGRLRTTRFPVRFSAVGELSIAPPPTLNADATEILALIGEVPEGEEDK